MSWCVRRVLGWAINLHMLYNKMFTPRGLWGESGALF